MASLERGVEDCRLRKEVEGFAVVFTTRRNRQAGWSDDDLAVGGFSSSLVVVSSFLCLGFFSTKIFCSSVFFCRHYLRLVALLSGVILQLGAWCLSH